jgi:hypothetical protein
VGDLEFYNVPLEGKGVKGRVTTLARRLLRKLLLPIFRRQVESLAVVHRRLDGADRDLEVLDTRTALLNNKLDLLNTKLDALNVKLDSLKGHQDEIRSEFDTVLALHWDHIAVARRLATLEDRLIGTPANEPSDSDEGPSIKFPGIEAIESGRECRRESAEAARAQVV